MGGPTTHTAKPEKHVLVFIGTSTPEKLRDFKHISEYKNLPIHFLDLRKLLDAFHSADETGGKYKNNVRAKLGDVEQSISMIAHDEGFLRKKCEEYGLPYDPANIYFATEDGGMSVPKDIWQKMDKQGIPEEILHRIDANKNDGGPGVETAPVLSATLGSANLMQRIISAARSLGYSAKSQVPVSEKVVLTLKPLKAEYARPPLVVEGKAVNYLYDPGVIDGRERRFSTLNFVYQKDHQNTSCADMGDEYVAKYGARSHAVDALARQLNITPSTDKAVHASHATDKFKLGVLPARKDVVPHTHLHGSLKKHNGLAGNFQVHFPGGESAGVTAQQSPTHHHLLGEIEQVSKASDGFILLPDAITGDQQNQFDKFYTLFSLVVAKQLVARDMGKPIIIMNHDGSWDEAIANHNKLANLGLTKDYNIGWTDKVDGVLPKSVTIDSNGYFDAIRGDSYEDTLHAALLLLNKKRERYQRRAPGEEHEFEGGIQPDPDKFKVAVFCSACNENTCLNENVEKLGYDLAKNRYGVVYGGGDRYTMGALLNGVVRHREELISSGMDHEDARKEAWIAGVSTAPILVSETVKGQFSPHLSFYKQTKNIYDRMAEILKESDAVVVAPGGAGTVQEWAAALMLKKTAPQLMKDKAIVIYNPALTSEPVLNAAGREVTKREQKVWDQALKTLLGQDYELLTKHDLQPGEVEQRKHRCRELGIYVESDLAGVEKRLNSLEKEKTSWVTRTAPAPACPEQGTSLH